MELLSKAKTGKVERPVKVLQFGEGNFLRAFVDYMIDIANESGDFNGDIVLVKPIEFGTLDRFHDQECQYTVERNCGRRTKTYQSYRDQRDGCGRCLWRI